MQINTNRLHIRNMKEADWEAVQKIFIDFNQSRYVHYDAPLPVENEEARELTKKFADSNLFFSVFSLDSNDLIGYICFHRVEEKYDLGYCFHSKYHGKGFAFESIAAVMKYYQENFGVKIFTASTAIENTPSCRLLKKLGFVCQSTETVSFYKDENGNAIEFQGGNFACEL